MKVGTTIAIAAAAAILVAGAVYFIDVDMTQSAKLPDVDVTVEGGQMPAVEVETGSVKVGTTEKTVTVPEVVMTEKTVTVPTVDVEPASD